MSKIEQKVTDMGVKFVECADGLTQRSMDFNFYETLVNQVQRETSKGKITKSLNNDDPYKLKNGNSETAYFNSDSQQSLTQTDVNSKRLNRRNIMNNFLGSSTIKSSSIPFLSSESKDTPSDQTLTYAQFV